MELTKGELELFYQDGKLYLECNTPQGVVRIAEMAMGHRNDSGQDAERLVLCWNILEKFPTKLLDEIAEDKSRLLLTEKKVHNALLAACEIGLIGFIVLRKAGEDFRKATGSIPLTPKSEKILDDTKEQMRRAIAEAKET